MEVTTQQTDNLLRFFKKSTTSHAIQQRSCPSSFEVNVQKMARVRIELKFWWKFSQIIIIFWGQFLPPAVYLSALFEVILTWRWNCWVMAPFNKKATSCLHMYVIIKGSNHQCWTLIMSIEKWDSNHFSLELLSFKNGQKNFWNSIFTMNIPQTTEIRKIEVNFGKRAHAATDRDRTPTACVTGLYTCHYTTGPSY